jgi:hypothetical protein
MGLHRTKGNQCLARTALRDYGTRASLLPTPDQTHDGESLSGIRFAKELANDG